MTPIRFGNQTRNTDGRRPLGKGNRKEGSDRYWQAFAQGKPVPPGPPPGAYVPAKAVEDAA